MRGPALAAGVVVVGVGAVQLYGWLSHTVHLIQLRPGQVPMQFNTALCFVLLGIALVALPTRWFRIAAVPATIAGVLGILTLVEYGTGRSLGIDRLLFDPWLTTGVDSPGRMARNTALCFAIFGLAIALFVLTGRRGGRMPLVVGIAASLVAGLALVALFGYAGGVSTAYTWRTSTAMAPLTALVLLVLAGGFVAAAWDSAASEGAPGWLPLPVGVLALAATLFLWQALVSLGHGDDRSISADRAAGLVVAIGLVFSALLAGATALGQAASRRRRYAESLARRLSEEGLLRAQVQEALLRRAQHDSVLRSAYAAVSLATDLQAGFAAFAASAADALTYDRATLSVIGADASTVVATAGPAAAALPVGASTPLTDPLIAMLVRSRDPYLMRDLEEQFTDSVAARMRVRSFVMAPLVSGGQPRALLSFVSERPRAFSEEDRALVGELTNVVGGALYTLARLEEERVATARLRELDQLKNEFVGVVAHDLRSPMTVIVGYVDTVLGRWDELPDQMKRELLAVASRNTKRLSMMVEDVLQVARIESGDFPYQIQPFDLGALVRRTAEEMSSARADRPVVALVPDDLPTALGDEDRQWRVLTNLISNAQKFSPEETPVVVAVRADGEAIEVSVTDRGPGIPEESLSLLFGKFSRLGAAPTGEQGTGLGLYICKALVEAQGGTIGVTSAPGEGTTMRYTVPVAGAVDG
jgi:signal transduction histidine kinase